MMPNLKILIIQALICSILIPGRLRGQTFSIDLTAGGGTAILYPVPQSAPRNLGDGPTANVQLSGTTRLANGVFIRINAGIAHSRMHMTGTFGNEVFVGWLTAQKFYVDVLPEYRFFKNKTAFLNAGLTLGCDLKNEYSGYIEYPDNSYIRGKVRYGLSAAPGFAANIGYRIRLGDFGPRRLKFTQTLGVRSLLKENIGMSAQIKWLLIGTTVGLSYEFD